LQRIQLYFSPGVSAEQKVQDLSVDGEREPHRLLEEKMERQDVQIMLLVSGNTQTKEGIRHFI